MQPQVEQAVEAGLRVLLYYGDTDMACNFLLGQRFSQSLNLKLIGSKKQWYHQKQVAGFVTKYMGLDFVTVKVSGEYTHLISVFEQIIVCPLRSGRRPHGAAMACATIVPHDVPLFEEPTLLEYVCCPE
jgi:hypothetical protein